MSQLNKQVGLENLPDAFERLRQEYEQLLVKLETAEEETASSVEQIGRLEAELKGLRNDGLRQRQTILELKSALAALQGQNSASAQSSLRSMEGEILKEELQVTNEELRASQEELEDANQELLQVNAGLEARVAERTRELERVVVQLSETVSQRDALLEAQSLLAREVDHRIKNSLQMVTSVLAMQAAGAESESEQLALQQACSRVQAVAHAHGLLYRSGGSDRVPFRDYLTALCCDLQSSLAPEEVERSIDCCSDTADIPVDYALPMALVVNELVTNAFKHAFPGGRKGRVEVSFQRRKPGGWRLTVADDGIGLPSWPPPAAPHSLGTRIVGALVERLHGRLEVATEGGTRFTLDVEPP
jgi:two-component sensor histidine kinase